MDRKTIADRKNMSKARMKMIMQEARKMAGEDRLTQKDLENAKRKLMKFNKKMSEGGILDRLKKFAASGKRPEGQIGKGSADTITGRIRVRKSVKEKEAEAAKKKAKTSNGKTQRYSDYVTKSNVKKGQVFTGEPRTIAEAKKRSSKTFINKKGKKLAAVTKEELAKSGLTLRQYLNKQQGKTAVGSKTTKAKKKVDRAAVRKKLGVGSNIAAGGSDLYMGLQEGGDVDFMVPEKIKKNLPYYLNKLQRNKKSGKKKKPTTNPRKLSVAVAKDGGTTNKKKKKITLKKVGKAAKEVFKSRTQRIRDLYKDTSLRPSGGDKIFKEGGMSNLKPVPTGNKGKGLRKLPRPVRNKMGYMSGGGVANGFGRAAMRPGKDPRSISKT